MSIKIYLSPSMQSHNTYAYGNTNEQEECNKIALLTKSALEQCGFTVSKAEKGQSVSQTIRESNEWAPDLHICIHTNAFDGKTLGGTLVMVHSMEEKNQKAGQSILDAVAPISPGSDYVLKSNPSLAELNSTKAVAVYLEIEFHDTIEGAKWIIENTENISRAICKGICNYFGIAYKSNEQKELYQVQIGLFENKSNAEKQLEKAKNSGFADAFIKKVTL